MKTLYQKALITALLLTASTLPLIPVLARAETAETEEVVVKGRRIAPNVPTTTEGVTAEALGKAVNVVTPEDTLRYVPNVLIRQRHFGDTQAPITTRTSGVGASARSLIYVDGILLSALIGNNNTSASPKWGLIAPEAVSRVDVLYGPFSAAYAGNSVGSVVAFTTRMPSKLEGTLEVQGASQDFRKYGNDDTYGTFRVAGSVGDRTGAVAWRLSYNHLDSRSHPLTYITASTAPSGTTGAFDDANRLRLPIKVLGSGGLEHQIQDNLSGRVTYDVTPQLSAAYTFGLFRNDDDAHVVSFLRDTATGAAVYTSGFAAGRYTLVENQLAQGLSLTSHGGGAFDYSLVASSFQYLDSHQRTPASLTSGTAGTGAWLDGTGWVTFDATGTWRPHGPEGEHLISFGYHHDRFRLKNPKYTLADWQSGAPGGVASSSEGRTQTEALWIQDVMRIGPRTKLTAGLRLESWKGYDGYNYAAPTSSVPAGLSALQPTISHDAVSPKIVLTFNPDPDWILKASVGAASRFPTVTELYQAVTTGSVLTVPNPNLKPERALSSELSAERSWDKASLRVSVFDERIRNTLLSQSASLVPGSSTLYSYIQNVDRTHATGIELVADQQDVLFKGLQVSGWLTYVNAKTEKDTAFAAAVGKDLPQIPHLRGALVLTYSPSPRWDISLAGRYSDRMYGTIDNSDTYANTYQGFSGYFVADAHVRYRMSDHWTAQLGVNNLNNRSYMLFHPFPQRTVMASLKYSY